MIGFILAGLFLGIILGVWISPWVNEHLAGEPTIISTGDSAPLRIVERRPTGHSGTRKANTPESPVPPAAMDDDEMPRDAPATLVPTVPMEEFTQGEIDGAIEQVTLMYVGSMLQVPPQTRLQREALALLRGDPVGLDYDEE